HPRFPCKRCDARAASSGKATECNCSRKSASPGCEFLGATQLLSAARESDGCGTAWRIQSHELSGTDRALFSPAVRPGSNSAGLCARFVFNTIRLGENDQWTPSRPGDPQALSILGLCVSNRQSHPLFGTTLAPGVGQSRPTLSEPQAIRGGRP